MESRLKKSPPNNLKTQHLTITLFHQRPLQDRHRFLLFDGVVLKRKSGTGPKKRGVLVASGIDAAGGKHLLTLAGRFQRERCARRSWAIWSSAACAPNATYSGGWTGARACARRRASSSPAVHFRHSPDAYHPARPSNQLSGSGH